MQDADGRNTGGAASLISEGRRIRGRTDLMPEKTAGYASRACGS